jgi:hypothetical protein
MVTVSRIALARTALSTVPLTRALALAQWTGAGRELTTTGVLRPAVAVEACRMLGIAVPSGKLRSAKDVPELDQAWAVALAADLVLVTADRASAAPDVAELVTMANGADETAELDDDLTERVVLARRAGSATRHLVTRKIPSRSTCSGRTAPAVASRSRRRTFDKQT